MCHTHDINHQLIVLGNGFDLACGLKSRFMNFLEPQMKVLEKLSSLEGKELVEAMNKEDLTVWDLILYKRKLVADSGHNVNWCDVEAVISDVTKRHAEAPSERWDWDGGEDTDDPEEQVSVYELEKFFDYLENHPGIGKPSVYAREREDDFVETEDYGVNEFYLDVLDGLPNQQSEDVGQYLRYAYPHRKSWTEEDIYEVLFTELGRLETRFDIYLRSEVHLSANYSICSSLLLKEIMSKDYSDLEGEGAEFTVFDFNYTSPEIPNEFRRCNCELVNIHGRLGDGIIFGADGTDCMGERGPARFTKTYRVAQRTRASVAQRVAYPHGIGLPGETETVAIKFYGHSLAQADYAYFQSIFDMVDLYSGNARLYFFYNNYAPSVREDYLDKIVKLLDAYGATLDNRDHGKNLMHKLLLEGRLVVEELSVSFL